jgi:hypothetical protein
MEQLIDIISANKSNIAKIRYYPSVTNKDGCYMIANDIPDKEFKKLKTSLNKYDSESLSYREYNIKDTYVKICENLDDKKRTEIYFRKKQYQFKIDGYAGIFTIELYNICEECDLPYIIDYDHVSIYMITKYMKDKIDISFFNINKKGSESSYMDISMDIDGKDIVDNINKFTEEIDKIMSFS